MPIPSFDELLSQARQIGEANSRARDFNRGELIASSVSKFVKDILTTQGDNHMRVGATVDPATGKVTTATGTIGRSLLERAIGVQGYTPQPGQFPINADTAAIFGLQKALREKQPTPDVPVVLSVNKKNNDVEEIYRGKPGEKVSIFGYGDTDGAQKEPGLESLIRTTAENLQKMRTTAETQRTVMPVINKALKLAKSGRVTGKSGQFKAFIAPYAEALGISSDSLSDAQSYQLLARSITGPMRLDIIGPGQVSDYEQKLVKEMSGGGGVAKKAAIELLNYYKTKSKEKISEYNTAAKNSYSLSPRFKDLHQPMDMNDSSVFGNDSADGNSGGQGGADEHGFIVGQQYKMKDGNMATYKGNGEFE